MKNTTKQQLLVLFLLLAITVSLPVGGAAFGQLQPPAPTAPAASTEPLFTPAPAPITATPNDGSIKGYFLANNGGVDFSINPDDPGGPACQSRT
jgi:hypothetical protein